jgi:hypothetical protein
VVEQFRPQVIILECVERSLDWLAEIEDDLSLAHDEKPVP